MISSIWKLINWRPECALPAEPPGQARTNHQELAANRGGDAHHQQTEGSTTQQSPAIVDGFGLRIGHRVQVGRRATRRRTLLDLVGLDLFEQSYRGKRSPMRTHNPYFGGLGTMSTYGCSAHGQQTLCV